ncbi:MAG: ATP-binding cassette domain-containing protein [Candidatus Aminicenantes bacterium]|nr:ATP-binding cassette domain-containing protein [Candidatus Aminicenantes bacterium]
MDAIRVENLTKTFKDVTAVAGVTFSVPEGELFGLLGPNGAGKTTTINILATLLRPTSGAAFVGGHDVLRSRDNVRKSIGVVFQEPALDGKLTGRENLEFHAMMYGLGREERRRRIDEVLALAFMLLISFAFIGLGLIFASRMKDMQGFGLVMNFIIFPLFFLSGAFYPLANLPRFIRALSLLDPLTYGVDGLRGAMVHASAHPLGLNLAVLSGFAVLMTALGAFFFEKSESV